MKYLRQICIIFGITLVGEFLNYVLPFPVPAGVYGLFILLILLCTGIVKLHQVEDVGNLLLDLMPVMFVPASVGLMEKYAEVKAVLLPLVIISIVSTIMVMIITGKVTETILFCKNKKRDEKRNE